MTRRMYWMAMAQALCTCVCAEGNNTGGFIH